VTLPVEFSEQPLNVLPHANIKPTTPEMNDWLRIAIGDDGKVYEDVTFKPM
jgi:hypothetical protein